MHKQAMLKDKDYYKVLIPTFAFELLLILGILLFASWLSQKPFLEFVMGLWPFLIVIPFGIIFMFVLKSASKSSRKDKSIAKLENDFKRALKQYLKRNLGKFALLSLDPDMNEMDVGQSGMIKQLLENEAKDNAELKYYLYALKGLYSIKSENINNAIESFKTAISLKPDCIICKTWLAEAYELIGDAPQAVNVYQKILDEIANKKSSLSDYFNEQIEIVTTKGPRKLPPMTGFKYLSY